MESVNLLLIFGAALLMGLASARITNKISTPHVVGFLLLGVFLGESALGIIPVSRVIELELLVQLVLGFVGFGMGEHLLIDELRKYGKSIASMGLFQVFGTFIFVLFGIYLLTKSIPIAVILAALSTATDPATTVDILKQYDSKGPLTTSLMAIVGIDDALAILTYSLSIPFALTFLSPDASFSLISLQEPIIEVVGSLILGAVLAYPADYILDRMEDREEMLLFLIASVLFVSGLALNLHLSVILSTLVFGSVTVNLKHKNARYISGTIDRVSPILYILFFVLIGARLDINLLFKVGLIGTVYLLTRTIGKILGSYVGAKISKAESGVTKYLGISMLSQAGVAIGLAFTLASRIEGMGPGGTELDRLIVNTIVGTTLIFQVIAPLLTKHAIFATGEARSKEGTLFG